MKINRERMGKNMKTIQIKGIIFIFLILIAKSAIAIPTAERAELIALTWKLMHQVNQ